MQDTDALLAWSSPITWNDPLNAHFLRCTKYLPLRANYASIDGAYEDVDAFQVLLELLEIVGQAPNADLDARCLQALRSGLLDGRRAHKHHNALYQFKTPLVIALEYAW